MNSISFTPSYSSYSVGISKNNYQNRPAFTGLTKAPKQAQAKEVMSVAKKLYSTLFIPSSEKIMKMNGDSVVTQSKKLVHGNKVVAKKYAKWSSRVLETVEDNVKTNIREHKVFNKNGTYDVTFKDMHTPQYDVSVGYKGLVGKEYTFGAYDGPVTLKYCGKSVDISAEKRNELIEKLDNSVNERFGQAFDDILHHRGNRDFEVLSNQYYKDPEVIGSAILKSPKYLTEQLSTIPSSMPYGIECIMNKIEKV